jgi:hypothetical protein
MDNLLLIPRDSYSSTCICEIPCSNLRQGNDYFEFRLFPFHLQANIGIVSQRLCRFLKHYIFTIHNYGPHLSIGKSYPWGSIHLGKFEVAKMIRNFPTTYGTGMLNHRSRKSLQLRLFWTNWIQAPRSSHFSLKSILTIYSNLLIYLKNDVFPSGSRVKFGVHFSLHPLVLGLNDPHILSFSVSSPK